MPRAGSRTMNVYFALGVSRPVFVLCMHMFHNWTSGSNVQLQTEFISAIYIRDNDVGILLEGKYIYNNYITKQMICNNM